VWSATFWVQLVADTNTYTPFLYRTANPSAPYVFFGCGADGTTLFLEMNTNGSGSALTVGTWYHVALTMSGSAGAAVPIAYLNGVSNITLGSQGWTVSNDEITIGLTDSTDNLPSNTRIAHLKIWDGVTLTAAQIVQEMATTRPQTALSSLHIWSPLTKDSKDYSGNARNWTEGGTLTWEDGPPRGWGASPLIVGAAAAASGVIGTLAQTLGALTLAATATVGVAAAATPTLGVLTCSGAATVAVSASSAPTLGALTASGTGTVAVGGALSASLGTLTVSGSAAVTAGPVGALAQSLGSLTGSGGGAVSVAGAGAASLGALTGAGTSSVAVSGAATPTLGALTASGASTVAVAGTSTPTLGAVTASGAASVLNGPAGVLSSTLGALTASGASTVSVAGASTPTLGAVTASGAASVLNGPAGVLSSTLGALTASGASAVSVAGASTPTLGALTAAGTATAPPSGALSQSLGALTCGASGAVTSGPVGALAQSLGALTALGSGRAAVAGTAGPALGALTASGAASVPLVATATPALDALTIAGAARVSVAATSSNALGALTCSASAASLSGVGGNLSATLDALTLAGTSQVLPLRYGVPLFAFSTPPWPHAGYLPPAVTWQNVVGCSLAGDVLTKTAGTAWGNAGAVSQQLLVGDGSIEWTIRSESGLVMAGLSNGDTDQGYADIDFCLYTYEPTLRVLVYQGGSYRTQGSSNYAVGDKLRLSVMNGVVRAYWKDVLLHEFLAPDPVFPLCVDSALYSQGSKLGPVTMRNAGDIEVIPRSFTTPPWQRQHSTPEWTRKGGTA
jgi:hypothetical protein